MFADFLSRLKRQTGIETQADLARALGISTSAVSAQKQKGTIPESWAYKLADRYGLRAEWLLNGTGDPKPGKVMAAMQPLDALAKREWAGRDPHTAPAPLVSADQLPEHLVVTRAVMQIEAAMLSVGVDESAVWKAIKTVVDGKVGAIPYGYRPPHAEERPPLLAERQSEYAAGYEAGLAAQSEAERPAGQDNGPPEEHHASGRRNPTPNIEKEAQR